MKPLLCFLILVFSSLEPLQAETSLTPAPTPAPAKTSRLYFEFAEGIDLPASAWQSAYTAAPAFKASVGFSIDSPWSLQLDLENLYYYGTNDAGRISDEEIMILPTVRYQWGGDVFKPYLLAGMGGELEILSGPPSGAEVADFDGALGAGVQTGLPDGFWLYLEGKYNFIFSSKAVGQDLPLWLGVHWDME